MISNVTLMYIHLRLAEIFNTANDQDGWFGQKHVLLFGDLLQLPPVREGPVFVKLSSKDTDKLLGSIGSVELWCNLFHYDELTINMRQRNDQSYREMLTRIRLGVVTDSDTEILSSKKLHFTTLEFNDRIRELCDYIKDLPNDTVCLLPTCRMCDVLNDAMLSQIPTEEIKLLAHDTIDCPPYFKKKVLKILNTDDEDSSRTGGLSKIITVKIGVKIMIRRNIDVTLGLVNGTIGKITSISRAIDGSDVETVRIVLATGIEHVIERVDVKFEVMEGAFIIRKQFPICLSYGITIHKSQGLSLKNAVIDAGNSVFSCGQVYVALSRVTSLEGLHLINYDPHAVLANTSAILEYNRLRNKYRPDLETMSTTSVRARKVPDCRWSIPKNVFTCQEPIAEKSDSRSWRIKGLQNADGVSCYANATIQCMFHSTAIRDRILCQKKTDNIRMLMENYVNLEFPGNVLLARKLAGEQFTLNVQQDAPEFITGLLSRCDDLKKAVEYHSTTRVRCDDCGYIITSVNESGYILLVVLTTSCKKTSTLSEIISDNFSRWKTVEGASCNNCSSNNVLAKTDVSSVSSCLIIQLLLHCVQDGQIVKISNYNIKAVPTDKILLCTKTYKVNSAIFHHGPNIEEGHYTCVLRDGKSAWKRANDNIITTSNWPRNAQDAYVFFLQQT